MELANKLWHLNGFMVSKLNMLWFNLLEGAPILSHPCLGSFKYPFLKEQKGISIVKITLYDGAQEFYLTRTKMNGSEWKNNREM